MVAMMHLSILVSHYPFIAAVLFFMNQCIQQFSTDTIGWEDFGCSAALKVLMGEMSIDSMPIPIGCEECKNEMIDFTKQGSQCATATNTTRVGKLLLP